ESLAVLAKIRGHVADAQSLRGGLSRRSGPSSRRWLRRLTCCLTCPHRRRMCAVPRSRLRQDGSGIVSGMKMQIKEEIAVVGRVVRLQGDSLSKGGNGLVQKAASQQRIAEAVVHIGHGGLDFQRLPIACGGLLNLPEGGVDDTEVAVGLHHPRSELH